MEFKEVVAEPEVVDSLLLPFMDTAHGKEKRRSYSSPPLLEDLPRRSSWRPTRSQAWNSIWMALVWSISLVMKISTWRILRQLRKWLIPRFVPGDRRPWPFVDTSCQSKVTPQGRCQLRRSSSKGDLLDLHQGNFLRRLGQAQLAHSSSQKIHLCWNPPSKGPAMARASSVPGGTQEPRNVNKIVLPPAKRPAVAPAPSEAPKLPKVQEASSSSSKDAIMIDPSAVPKAATDLPRKDPPVPGFSRSGNICRTKEETRTISSWKAPAALGANWRATSSQAVLAAVLRFARCGCPSR